MQLVKNKELLSRMIIQWNSDKHAPFNTLSDSQKEKVVLDGDFRFYTHEWCKHGYKSGARGRNIFFCMSLLTTASEISVLTDFFDESCL